MFGLENYINTRAYHTHKMTCLLFTYLQIDASTGVVTDLNIVGLDYYKQLPGLYNNNRPIYTRFRGNLDTQLYLFYVDGYWQVGYNYTESRSVIHVEGDSTRPEHVLGTWRLYTNGKFSPVVAKLRCRGM